MSLGIERFTNENAEACEHIFPLWSFVLHAWPRDALKIIKINDNKKYDRGTHIIVWCTGGGFCDLFAGVGVVGVVGR